jgi:hypothetical protein
MLVISSVSIVARSSHLTTVTDALGSLAVMDVVTTGATPVFAGDKRTRDVRTPEVDEDSAKRVKLTDHTLLA